jgi:hypothetical protein
MDEQVVLIGEVDERDGRVVLVGQAGVRVDVGEQVAAEPLLQRDEGGVEEGVGLGRVVELIGVGHPVASRELPVDELVEVDVDAVPLQAGDEVVEPVERVGIEVLCVSSALIEEVRVAPPSAGVVGANGADAEEETSCDVDGGGSGGALAWSGGIPGRRLTVRRAAAVPRCTSPPQAQRRPRRHTR